MEEGTERGVRVSAPYGERYDEVDDIVLCGMGGSTLAYGNVLSPRPLSGKYSTTLGSGAPYLPVSSSVFGSMGATNTS